jgi:hypothetical protein
MTVPSPIVLEVRAADAGEEEPIVLDESTRDAGEDAGENATDEEPILLDVRASDASEEKAASVDVLTNCRDCVPKLVVPQRVIVRIDVWICVMVMVLVPCRRCTPKGSFPKLKGWDEDKGPAAAVVIGAWPDAVWW